MLFANISDELLRKLENVDGDDIITYLYAMRQITSDFPGFKDSSLIFPPRHELYDVNIAKLHQHNPIFLMSIESLVNTVVNCFAGELPKVFQVGFQLVLF